MVALKGSQACIDQTQPGTAGAVHRATSGREPENALRDDFSSPGPCNSRIKKAVGKAQGARETRKGQADPGHRRGKLNPAHKAGDWAGNCPPTLVLGHNRQPAMPCLPARARQLKKSGRAATFRKFPYTIILKEPKVLVTQPCRLKTDPGSKTTGITVTATHKKGETVVFPMELRHRGQEIRDSLLQRRQLRRSRRSRKTRYRPARFANRRKPEGWLPPSIQHRVDSTTTWAKRLLRWLPITSTSVENVRFDTQLMQDPTLCGVDYQNGELAGWEVREYLLVKHGYLCAYCGEKSDYYEVEHLTPVSRGGSSRISNLVLSCEPCNKAKGNMTCEEFGHPHLRQVATRPLKDAAAVNSTRWALWESLKSLGLPMEGGSGGRTKKNRHDQGYPKAHWIDAACVGESGAQVRLKPTSPALVATAQVRRTRRMCLPDRFGFPRTAPKTRSRIHGFATGDFVTAQVPSGKKQGTHTGRVSVRGNGYFRVGNTDGISYKHCVLNQASDGYSYSTLTTTPAVSSPPTRGGVSDSSLS